MRLYFKALADGWKLTSKHNWLWLFGLFALLIGGNGGEYDLYFKNVSLLSSQNSVFSVSFWQKNELAQISERLIALWTNNWITTILLGSILLFSLLFVLYFIIVSQISLVYAAAQGPKNGLTFHDCYSAGQKYFWPVLTINIISKAFIFAVLFLIVFSFSVPDYFYQTIYSILGSLLLVPAVIIVSFLSKYAVNFIVLKNEKIFPAIKKGAVLFAKNCLVSLEMALIIFILSILLGLFIMLSTAVVLSPFLASVIGTAQAYADPLANIYTVLMLAALILVMGMVLAASIFSAWQWTSWTYLFKELTKGPKESKLVRILQTNN